MNPNSFTVYIKTDNIYKDIAVDAEITSDTSIYELYRLLPIGNKKMVSQSDNLRLKIKKKLFRNNSTLE